MFCNIPNANVAAIADGTAGNADSRTMAYDGLDRLTTTNAPHQWWISATTTYDALDNIRANQVGNTATYLNTFSYDPTTWHLTAIAGHVNWALSESVFKMQLQQLADLSHGKPRLGQGNLAAKRPQG